MIRVRIDRGLPMPRTVRRQIRADRSEEVGTVEHILSAHKTLKFLEWGGKKLRYDEEARDTAAKILMVYAEHPLQMGTMTDKQLETHSAASMALAGELLENFGKAMVTSAAEVRNLITNKLIVETDNPDPKVRLKALEMLGKVSDVGLFVEKSEITIKDQTDGDLRDRLRAKLERLRKFESVAAGAEDAILVDDALEHLGLPPPMKPPSAEILMFEPADAESDCVEGPFDDDPAPSVVD